MSSVKIGGGRITQLDGLRACAILAVFLSHAFKIRMLWIGVDLFFVLSGFLITGILVDLKHKDLKGYFAHFHERRARRILPPYVMLLHSCYGVAVDAVLAVDAQFAMRLKANTS